MLPEVAGVPARVAIGATPHRDLVRPSLTTRPLASVPELLTFSPMVSPSFIVGSAPDDLEEAKNNISRRC